MTIQLADHDPLHELRTAHAEGATLIEGACRALVSYQRALALAIEHRLDFPDIEIADTAYVLDYETDLPAPDADAPVQPVAPEAAPAASPEQDRTPDTRAFDSLPASIRDEVARIAGKSAAQLKAETSALTARPRLTSAPRPGQRKRRRQMLTPEQEAELIRCWQDDRDADARAELLDRFEPLIRRMVEESGGASWDYKKDLLQEARLALIESLDKVDPAAGRISAFCRNAIKHAIHRFMMDQSGTTRVGTNLSDKRVYFNFSRLRRQWESRFQKDLNDQGRLWIAHQLGVSVETVARMEPRLKRNDVPIDTLGEDPAGHVEGGINSRGVDALIEALTDPAGTPESQLGAQQAERLRLDMCGRAIEQLPEITRDILRLRFAEDGKVSYAEIGARLAAMSGRRMTRKQVRKYEEEALSLVAATIARAGYEVRDLA
ncbi:sigma-70 family RNA polymerase sigma factor [Rhodovibrio sodomensis]|nr:sigma-70 family RNA polymerase sigma factor [Rhodovibrio sodomensis]